jgi:NO-binding membrane sensor protein with MHYT domain/signal transduction histidine kinase
MVLVASYDYLLVALSVIIAVLASYAALDLARRVTSAQGKSRPLWLSGGATAMGFGIWSMHYIGMLAFRLPMPVQYDWPTVLLSLLAAILASGVALFVVSRQKMGVIRASLGSILMGSAIAAMHYIGMAAMRLPAMCHYSPSLFILSVVLAIVISFVALWLTFHFRGDPTAWSWRKTVSALVMGAAIPVMHYTGMAAASFTASMSGHQDLSHAISVSSLSVAGISIVTFVVLGSVLLTSLRFDSLSNTRQLTVRYFLSLGAISLLAMLGTLLIEHQGQQSRSDARVVNIAGRQRMLSQAIAKQALLVTRSPDFPERQRMVEDLRNLDTLWEHSHSALQHGDPLLGLLGTNSPQVRQMFAALDPQYTAMVGATRAIVAKVSGQKVPVNLSAEIDSLLAHEGPYLQAMDAIVFQYDREATFREDRKNQLHFGLLLSILGVLLLQGLVVLRPALARIQQGISELVLAKQELHRQATFVELLEVVAVAANEATSVEAALQFTLDRICEHTGWPVGHVYFCTPETSTDLTSSTLWHFDNAAQFETFRQVTEKTPLAIGAGLPGRVVESGKPSWIPDINEDTNFPRRKVALDLGVKGAFGFPVLAQGEVVAVLEFFSRNIEEPDSELLTVMAHVGAQLGQLMERTRAQENLARKAEELARSNADLEVFAYVASHDLQEPLRMVTSYTQLLARRYKGKLDTDADDFISFAVDGARRMQTLILDLLCYSRVTTKGQSLQLTQTKAACATALQNLQTSIKECNAVVNVGAMPSVLADEAQVAQLFQNLIGNALKYRNERRPEIQVTARANGKEWVFSVQDNGIGMEPQYFERIFQMFQRLHTREQYTGTGIGLAICRKIVERHGGRIWVESQPGEGSTFLFTIPRAEGETNEFKAYRNSAGGR